jgi:hypothetical protein
MSISFSYKRPDEVPHPRCSVAFAGRGARFSNDEENWLSGVEFEVKRLPKKESFSVSDTLLFARCQRKNPGAWERLVNLVWILLI